MNPLPVENPPLETNSGSLPLVGSVLPPAVPAVILTSAMSPPQKSGRNPIAAWVAAWIFDSETMAWFASALVHVGIVLGMSMIVVVQQGVGPGWFLEGIAANDLPEMLDVELESLANSGDTATDLGDSTTFIGLPDLQLGSESIEVGGPELSPSAVATVDTPASDLEGIGRPLASLGGGLEGRLLGNRRATALSGGGSAGSEAAVEAGLKWLAAHQLEDGSWTFRLDEAHCPQCAGQCRNPGLINSKTASTGLALLCFLGGGYTHETGPYRDEVSRGLYFLVHRMMITEEGGDLRDRSESSSLQDNMMLIRKSGDMYSHAIATLALCEAYAMTEDRDLASAAQEAIAFIVNAQHEGGGGRYEPKDPGDLSVTGWQLMALKSGALGRLAIPRDVWYRATTFLDSLQFDRGTNYGYQEPKPKSTAITAVGLYGRLLLGWPAEHAPLLKGTARLSKEKPAENNMYFNYYTSLVLHHVGGTGWKRWNPRMRNYLVGTQADTGHETGSWYFDEAWSDRGGRLYSTTLAILTLEVYYRYMPMYRSEYLEAAP